MGRKGAEEYEGHDATKKDKIRWPYVKVTCPTCLGSGKRGIRQCTLCKGKTKIWAIK